MTDAELLNLYDDTAPLPDDHLAGLRAVERAARAAEREACAKVAATMLRHYTQAVTGVPEAIRARGEK